MTEAVDSSYHAQFDTIIDPGQDMELEALDISYPQASDNTSTSLDNFFEAFLSNDTLASQYSYPPPPAAYNYRPHPYPDPSVQTTEQIAACYTRSSANTGAIRTRNLVPTYEPTIAPSQTILQRKQDTGLPRSRTRDDSRTQDEVGKSKQPTAQKRQKTTTLKQSHARIVPPRQPPRAIQPANMNLFQDYSTPYVPGHNLRREDGLQGLTDAATAVIERPSFQCSDCGKICKTKTGLNHHKVTHDPEKMTRHKCQVCDSGFRYPKDLERHHASVHDKVQYPCADCHTVFYRRDHLDRHMKSQGHIAASGARSLPPVSLPMSPATSTNAYEESSFVDASPSASRPPIQSYGYSARQTSLNQQSLSRLDPTLPQPSLFSSASFTTGSINDTFTVSEDNSFWSNER